MRKKAEERLGESIRAGIVLQPVGHFGRAQMATGFISLGNLLSAMRVRRAERKARARGEANEQITEGSGGYLAVTPTRIALFSLRQGFLGLSLDRLLFDSRVKEFSSLVVHRTPTGLGKLVDVAMGDGHRFRFELSGAMVGKLRRVADAAGLPLEDTTPPRSVFEKIAIVLLLAVIAAGGVALAIAIGRLT